MLWLELPSVGLVWRLPLVLCLGHIKSIPCDVLYSYETCRLGPVESPPLGKFNKAFLWLIFSLEAKSCGMSTSLMLEKDDFGK